MVRHISQFGFEHDLFEGRWPSLERQCSHASVDTRARCVNVAKYRVVTNPQQGLRCRDICESCLPVTIDTLTKRGEVLVERLEKQ